MILRELGALPATRYWTFRPAPWLSITIRVAPDNTLDESVLRRLHGQLLSLTA